MRIRVITAIWDRHDVLRVFAQGIKRLLEDKRFELTITSGCSKQEDYDVAESLGLCPVMTVNTPLGKKFNSVMKFAMEDQWDYALILGSDDLISNDGLQALIDLNCDHSGVDKMVAVNSFDGSAVTFKLQNKLLRLIGAGRLVSREALEKTMQKSGPLWAMDINRGLDYSMEQNLISAGYKPRILRRDKVDVVDIKSLVNINGYDALYRITSAITDAGDCRWFMSDEEKQLLDDMRTVHPEDEQQRKMNEILKKIASHSDPGSKRLLRKMHGIPEP